MNGRSITPKQLLLLVLILAVLVYLRYESNKEKADQQLLKETMEKPIGQIQRELDKNPAFMQMIQDAEESNDSR